MIHSQQLNLKFLKNGSQMHRQVKAQEETFLTLYYGCRDKRNVGQLGAQTTDIESRTDPLSCFASINS
jgi:hypothetical protein